ncbi:DUF4097 family beta strand repeat-containing protein [Paenibacillus sp. FSL R5-0517]|uniref:DUF4097 family beta strand repeat-containing protein n=1 Tax=unclassified Paenibacillus TaxID=185978 RepID=UPI0030DA4D9F
MTKVISLCFCLLFVLTSCSLSSSAITDTQKASLNSIDLISIDNGSTPITVETVPDITSLEVSSNAYDHKPVFNMVRGHRDVRISASKHMVRIFNLANTPVITVRVPLHYEGDLRINSSSGKVQINHIQSNIWVDGTSGSIDINADRILSNIHLVSTSGNITLNVMEENPNVNWTMESRSGRRSHSLDLQQISDNKHTSKGTTGQGKYQVHILTKSGNISIQ